MFSQCSLTVFIESLLPWETPEPNEMYSHTNIFPWSNQLAVIESYRQLRGKYLAAREQAARQQSREIMGEPYFPIFCHLFIYDIKLRTS